MIIVKTGETIFATHTDDQDVAALYPDADLYTAPDGSVAIEEDGTFTLKASAELTAYRRKVAKLTVIERLDAAGLFAAVMAALGGTGDLPYERWAASSEIYADDADFIAVLTSVGADPEVILA